MIRNGPIDTSNYKEKMKVWADRTEVIQTFALAHPRSHSIHRMGDHLECRTCQVTEFAPCAGPRPKDSMEASLSRFD